MSKCPGYSNSKIDSQGSRIRELEAENAKLRAVAEAARAMEPQGYDSIVFDDEKKEDAVLVYDSAFKELQKALTALEKEDAATKEVSDGLGL